MLSILWLFGDHDWIWRWIDNWEFRIEFGDATFTFGDRDYIWRLRSKLEIAILLREICGRCVPPYSLSHVYRSTLWVDLINSASIVHLYTYVRPSVRAQLRVSSISMKFGMYVEVDEWCTNVKVKDSRSRALESWKSFHFQQLSPPPFTMGAGNWTLILIIPHNIYIWSGRIFDICPSFCVTWLWTWQKRQLCRVYRQSHKGRIYFSFTSDHCLISED